MYYLHRAFLRKAFGRLGVKPSVFEYQDYRKYLNDLVSYLRETQKTFSFRNFCRQSGFSSSSTLKLVMDGKRKLSEKGIRKVIKGLKLSKEEGAFFTDLVMMNQADNAEDKGKHLDRMMRNKKFSEIKPLARDQYEYSSRWYIPAIREMVVLPDFREDPKWIAKRLEPNISIAEAKEAINILVRLQLIEREQNGRFKQVDPNVTTDPEVFSIAFKRFYREMMSHAMDSIENVKPQDRDISGAIFALPKSKLPAFKEELFEFRKHILAKYGTTQESADDIYQLNLQLFPITKKDKPR